MPFYTCDGNTLIKAAACFLEPNIGKEDREAIELHARVNNLFAIGGADYRNSIAKLMTAAAKWRNFACNQRDAIATYRTVQDAVDNGSGIATDINTLRKKSACYLHLGHEDKKNLLAFLSCSINTLGQED